MSYGKPSVHHLEPVIERTWNPVRVFGYGIPHIQVFDKPIWNKPLSDETLDTLETTIRRAIERDWIKNMTMLSRDGIKSMNGEPVFMLIYGWKIECGKAFWVISLQMPELLIRFRTFPTPTT